MKLKEVMDRKGVTIEELVILSGVSKYLIIMIRKGYKNYKKVTIWKLANALGVDAKEIEND